MKLHTSAQKLSINPDTKWFEHLTSSAVAKAAPNPDVLIALKAESQNLLDMETRIYHKLRENKKEKDFMWIKKILQAGTLSDKVSAHTLLVQDSPVYNLNSLDTLVGMVTTKGKRECLMAMDALQDLFIGELLVEGRKLKPFSEQPLEQLSEISQNSPALQKQIQLLWIFEDRLKELYKKFIKNLEAVTHDTIEKTKIKAVTVMSKLLMDNCEEEQFLLEHVVNKVGDPIPKVGSHVCHQLGAILNHHTLMKTTVVREVERLIFRQNLSERPKYYALCFLNQVVLSHEEFQLANHLIMIYFGQFKLFVKKGEVNTKMMSALLTGVARAYPYAKLKDNVIIEQLDAMYRLVHMVSFNISIQALLLIFQVLDSSDSVSDRFYSVLYRKLFDPALGSSSRQASILSLVYRALKKDVAVIRVKAFVKRLLQVALYQAPSLQCGILILISELNKVHDGLLEVKHNLDSEDESDEHYEDLSEEETETNKSDVKIKIEKSDGQSWVHRHPKKKTKAKVKSAYDFDCRNPLHANADCQSLWELLFLKQSFHPSVSLFAHQVSNSSQIKYSGDPLMDFTTARFLDRFVYRNPKKAPDSMHSDAKTRVFGGRKLKVKTTKKLPVLSNQFLQQNKDKIPIEEQFIYTYLHSKGKTTKKKEKDSDIESIGSDDFQNLLDDIHPEDDSLNFAKELGLAKHKKSSKRKASSDSEASEAEEMEDGESDEEFEFEGFGDEFNGLGEEDLAVCEDDFEDESSKNMKPSKKKSKTNQRFSDENLLADADEFSALLEEGADSKMDTLTSEAFRTKDNSHAKQLKWEMKRNQFIKGKKKPKFWKKKPKRQNKA